MLLAAAVAVAAGLSAPWPAGAAEAGAPRRLLTLDIGLGAAVTSLDPHYHRYTPNQAVAMHIFDPLIALSDRLTLEPALATSWEAVTPTVWRFHLRPGVRFHDGQPLTSRDVAASLHRPARVSDSPFSQAEALARIAEVRPVDDLTLDLRTAHPMPSLPRLLVNLPIVPAALEAVGHAAFADPLVAVGTGPFRMLGGTPGDRLFLAANDAYWGGRPRWDRVTLHVLPDDAQRVTALLDGTVDLIEHVPPVDAARLMANPSLRVTGRPSTRVIYLGLDVGRETTPHILDNDGRPLPNPLRRAEVRAALDLAIDRSSLLRDVLQGHGAVASQVLAPDVIGHAPELVPPRHDLAEARRLMAEAGYADGFRLTLHCPTDRYVADVQVARTVARMFDRLGVRATATCLPAATFFQQASEGAFSVYLAGLAVSQGDGAEALQALIGRPAADGAGRGALNRGGWGDAETDALLAKAEATADPVRREALLRDAVRRASAARALLPLHIQQSTWAMRADLEYAARADELTLAYHVRPAFP